MVVQNENNYGQGMSRFSRNLRPLDCAVFNPLQDKEQRKCYDKLYSATPMAAIQQSSLWAEVIAPLGPDRPVFLMLRDGDQEIAGLPLYLFESVHGSILTSVPQAGPLGGIFVHPAVPTERHPAIYGQLLDYAKQIAQELRCLAMTIISHPFMDDARIYESYGKPDFIFENFTQFIDLKHFQRPAKGIRDNLFKAREAELDIRMASDANWLEQAYPLHEQRHRRLGITPLPKSFFAGMIEHLQKKDHISMLGAWDRERLVGACILIHHQKILDIMMLNMLPTYAQYHPNSLLIDVGIQHACTKGIQIWNWQSSPDRKSGVYRYKKLWRSYETTYYFMTWVFGDWQTIKNMGRQGVIKHYPWHYVLPFALLQNKTEQKYFVKDLK